MLIPAPKLWLLGAALAVVAQLYYADDWQHLLWAAILPMLALLATSGAILAIGRARTALLSLAVLTVLPLVILTVKGGLDTYEVTAVESIPVAVQEVLSYGFNGEVPACMEPRPDSIAAGEGRTLASPSRDVTVPMGALYLGSIAITLIGLIVIVSKAIPRGAARAIWLYVSPLSVFVLLKLIGGLRIAEAPIWENDPELVAAVGPLAAAAAAALVIGLAVADRPNAATNAETEA